MKHCYVLVDLIEKFSWDIQNQKMFTSKKQTKKERKRLKTNASIQFQKMAIEKSEFLHLNRLLDLSSQMSGAEIVNVCNKAVLNAIKKKKSKVEEEDFFEALGV